MVKIFWLNADAKKPDSSYDEKHNKIYRTDIIHKFIIF
jgi:hypothetical protein